MLKQWAGVKTIPMREDRPDFVPRAEMSRMLKEAREKEDAFVDQVVRPYWERILETIEGEDFTYEDLANNLEGYSQLSTEELSHLLTYLKNSGRIRTVGLGKFEIVLRERL